MANLSQLRDQVRACQLCPLYKAILVAPNIGVGSTHPDVVFVLGGVDRDNLIYDKPFGSRDELVLLTAMKRAGLSPSQCYVTPIIRCGTITHNKKNVVDCIGWLKAELNILKPKCIFFLGDGANKLFMKLCPESTIQTFYMSSGLAGIFNKNSLMTSFVDKLTEVKNYICKES